MSDDDDDAEPTSRAARGPPWHEFDCPECTANNPYDDGFDVGDELTCLFCGIMWRAKRKDDGFRMVEA